MKTIDNDVIHEYFTIQGEKGNPGVVFSFDSDTATLEITSA